MNEALEVKKQWAAVALNEEMGIEVLTLGPLPFCVTCCESREQHQPQRCRN